MISSMISSIQYKLLRKIIDTIGTIDDLIEKNEEIANKCEAFARENFTEMIKKTKLYVPFDKILSRCSTG